MATQGTVTYNSVYANQYIGARHFIIPFTAVANSDTWASGINGIVAVAWAPTASDDQVAVTESAGTVTFSTSGATDHAGNLHIFTKGY